MIQYVVHHKPQFEPPYAVAHWTIQNDVFKNRGIIKTGYSLDEVRSIIPNDYAVVFDITDNPRGIVEVWTGEDGK